jgi:hypothetical protein
MNTLPNDQAGSQNKVTRRQQIAAALSLPPVPPPQDVLLESVATYLEELAMRSKAIPLA